jgi:hypothetical protein
LLGLAFLFVDACGCVAVALGTLQLGPEVRQGGLGLGQKLLSQLQVEGHLPDAVLADGQGGLCSLEPGEVVVVGQVESGELLISLAESCGGVVGCGGGSGEFSGGGGYLREIGELVGKGAAKVLQGLLGVLKIATGRLHIEIVIEGRGSQVASEAEVLVGQINLVQGCRKGL